MHFQLAIQILIMLVEKYIERELQVLANSLEDPLFHGPPRKKTSLLYPPSKPNMFLSVVVVYNYFG
jgi:hypothetical protein